MKTKLCVRQCLVINIPISHLALELQIAVGQTEHLKIMQKAIVAEPLLFIKALGCLSQMPPE